MENSKIKTLDPKDWLSAITDKELQTRVNYKAMYSSWWGGIVKDPNLMLVPIDDHQVHRGDAVFEAMKVVNSKIYLVDEHLDRLNRSAKSIHLINPYTKDQLLEILNETLKVSGLTTAILRLFLSRGPGSFSTSPYDTQGTQLYLIVTELVPVSNEKINSGVNIKVSKIEPKEPWLAQIKSCNYLHNVLMKKEAIDLGVDFTIGVNSENFITEGSTENIIILNQKSELLKPMSINILRGTTMEKAFKLSESLDEITFRGERNISLDDVFKAKEVMMIGTTLDVISVVKLEDQLISKGKPGPIANKLRSLLLHDQK